VSRLLESHQDVERQGASNIDAVFFQRHELKPDAWYWSSGLRTGQYWFDNRGNFPLQHLQDYAAQFGLEYFVDGKPAASLTIRPGFYFQTQARLASWDIPMNFVTGIPIVHNLNGVIGVSEARFYPRPVPIAGLSWTINDWTHLDAVYPEPAITMDFNPALQLRVGGRLIGDGFLADSQTGLSKIEYYEYRTGATVSYKLHSGVKLVGETGYTVERVFDFFDASRKLQANGTPYIHLGIELSR